MVMLSSSRSVMWRHCSRHYWGKYHERMSLPALEVGRGREDSLFFLAFSRRRVSFSFLLQRVLYVAFVVHIASLGAKNANPGMLWAGLVWYCDD